MRPAGCGKGADGYTRFVARFVYSVADHTVRPTTLQSSHHAVKGIDPQDCVLSASQSKHVDVCAAELGCAADNESVLAHAADIHGQRAAGG